MSKLSRTKGHNGEREVCAILTDYLGHKVTRNINQVRDGGGDVPLDPYLLEVKRRCRIGSIYQWMKQAEKSATEETKIPVLVMRSDNERWLVTMYLPDWIACVREEVVETYRDKEKKDGEQH